MSDVLTKKQRSFCMSQIKATNTKPEVLLRKALWSCGYRYRIKSKLSGKPDIVFPGLKVVIFIDGCFWHKCPLHYVPPKTRAGFWKEKIHKNVDRDKRNNALLISQGWKVIRMWEHEIKDSLGNCVEHIVKALMEQKTIYQKAID